MLEALTVIVPVYNEEENLKRVEKELSDYIKMAHVPTQVLFVNDGSKDNSQKIIEEICAANPDFTFINFEKNCGLSAAIKAGFDHITTSLTGYIDSDLQTDPMDFNTLLDHLEGVDLVTGYRNNRKDSFVQTTDDLSKLLTIQLNQILHMMVR